MAILVTGGAGYIGSIMVEVLRSRGERVIVLDNLDRGHRTAVAQDIPFYDGDVGDRSLVKQICTSEEVDACIHFAALAYVGKSVAEPRRYFDNNVEHGIALLDSLLECGVRRFVFSSTCATYGEPVRVPIDETHPQQPANPYGWSKLFLEKILAAYDAAYGMKFVALRYFNASGAIPGRGEHHDPESHLVPNVIFAAMGRLDQVSVFGSDYPTPDGTAIRDYIHVADLCDAHVLALDYLRNGGASDYFNLGNGQGYSVQEVIDAARKVTGREIRSRIEGARSGDPSRLIADSRKAHSILGWRPRFNALEDIIRSAWEWHSSHPHGYD